MNHILVLSQDNLRLAEAEATILLGLDNKLLVEHFLLCNVKDIGKLHRLAFTKKVYEILYVVRSDAVKESLKLYDWSVLYRKSFCIRVHGKYSEKELAKYVWNSLEDKGIMPKVDLENPGLHIEIFAIDEMVLVSRLICENTEVFDSRKAHLKPEMHPTAMHPKMARALVNMSAADSITDPFCGAGGILLEAALMGVKCTGFDSDQIMLNRAKINMQHYGINEKSYTLHKKDSTTLKNLKNVVTDLPYGKSSKHTEDISKLYSKFLKNISGRAVIVFPDFIDYKRLLKNLKKGLSVIDIIPHYVHKSLTRMIVVIDRKKAGIKHH